MLEKRRNGRVSTKTSIGDEIAHLRGLDLKGLRSRWQSVFQKPPPDHLPRHLLFAIITYRIQADRLGDLDHETRQVLDRTDTKSRYGLKSWIEAARKRLHHNVLAIALANKLARIAWAVL